MALQRWPRIEQLTGAAPDELTTQQIESWPAAQLAEDTDLDFKAELYGNGDSDKRELASDVAALANAGGGLLVLGVEEDDGRATATPGVPLSDGETLRMRQILASNVVPYCTTAIYRVPTSPSKGFYVIEVPRSAQAPHAVRKGDDLRFPRRDGTRTRWLVESEVADAYRSRFESARGRVAEVDSVAREGRADVESMGDWDTAWLLVSLVPEQPGSLTLDHHSPQRIATELRERPHPLAWRASASLRQKSTQQTTGFRRVVVTQGKNHESGRFGHSRWHLHTNGAGFAAVWVGRNRTDADWNPIEPIQFLVDDETLVIELTQVLAALAEHAFTRCGSGPVGLGRAELFCRDQQGQLAPVHLVYHRGTFPSDVEGPGFASLPPSERTLDLGAIQASPVELLIAARLFLTDLVQSLGVAECWQIDAEGRLRRRYFRSDWMKQIGEPWATAAGVELTEDTPTQRPG